MQPIDENKPIGKPNQRKGKAEPRNSKPDQKKSPTPDQLLDVKAHGGATAASTDIFPTGAQDAKAQFGAAIAPALAVPAGTGAADDSAAVNLQAIANAYGDYTRKSLEQTRSYFEKLTGVRSIDKAVEVQTEFGKQAYETFVTQSQKIFQLHGDFARQRLKRLEGLVTKATPPAR